MVIVDADEARSFSRIGVLSSRNLHPLIFLRLLRLSRPHIKLRSAFHVALTLCQSDFDRARLAAEAGRHRERAARFLTRPAASCPLRVRSASTINPVWKTKPMINTISPGTGPTAARANSCSSAVTGVG